jgi:hypothetical protein
MSTPIAVKMLKLLLSYKWNEFVFVLQKRRLFFFCYFGGTRIIFLVDGSLLFPPKLRL